MAASPTTRDLNQTRTLGVMLMIFGLLIVGGSQVLPSLLSHSPEGEQGFFLWYFAGPFLGLLPLSLGALLAARDAPPSRRRRRPRLEG